MPLGYMHKPLPKKKKKSKIRAVEPSLNNCTERGCGEIMSQKNRVFAMKLCLLVILETISIKFYQHDYLSMN